MLRFLAGAVREPDDREPGYAGLQVSLDLDPARLETDERLRERASEHPATMARRRSRMVTAFAPIPFLLTYGV